MIEVSTLESEGFEGEFYKLHFQRLGFLLFPRPDLGGLAHFSRGKQRSLGKTNILFNLTSVLNYPHFFRDIHYVLLTDYQEVLLLPFLNRMIPNVTIIASNLACHLARISLQAFQERLADFDTTHEQANFFRESEILGGYEEEMKVTFEDWRKLYSKEETTILLKKIVKVNYHQIFNTERGILIRGLPSGKNNGACFWQLQAQLTNEKILLVNELSQYSWRTCQPYSIDRLRQSEKESPYKLVLFTKKATESYAEGQELRIVETIRRVNHNAELGISTSIVLDDETLCIDLIPRLLVQPEGKIREILLGHESAHSMHNYVNSYADYLSQHYKDQLFSDTPDYPLIHYSKLREKGFLLVGTLEELAIKKKLPLREIVLQSHPFVRFLRSYEHSLEMEDEALILSHVKHNVERVTLGSNFSSVLLDQFVNVMGQARVVGFQPGLSLECLEIGRKYVFGGDSKPPLYLISHNFGKQTFQHFTLTNNELELKKRKQQLLKIPGQWTDTLSQQLSAKGLIIDAKDKNTVKTESTTISLSEDYQLRVTSNSAEQLLVVGKCLENFGKKYDLV